MFLRFKLVPALLAGLLVVGCGGSDTGSDSTTPFTPIVPVTDIPFSSLPQGSFSLALKRTGEGTLPGDKNIYVQIVSQPCKNSSPCARGDTTIVTNVTLIPTKVTGGPNGDAILGAVSVAQPNSVLTPFKVSDLINGNVILPGDAVYGGSRIYISMGKPLTMKVNPTGDGYIQTDFNNPSDPNISVPFDFVELAYDAKPNATTPEKNTVAFGANLTQVDQFGMPLAFTITGVKGAVLNRGITLGSGSTSGVTTRDQIIQNYLNAVSTPFKELTQTVDGNVMRILAPYHVASFKPGGTYANFFDSYVDQVWTYYQYNTSTIYDQPNNIGNKYVISGNGTVLHVTRNGVALVDFQKPSTIDVFQNNGRLQPGGDNDKAFGAILSGALNRHVADQPQNWLTPSAFYLAEPRHDYAKFWHQIGILNLAYGFGFDDTANQSSVAILSPTENIASFNIDIGW